LGYTKLTKTKKSYPLLERIDFEKKLTKKAVKLLNLDMNEDNEQIVKTVIYHVDKLSNIIIDSYIKSKEEEKCKT